MKTMVLGIAFAAFAYFPFVAFAQSNLSADKDHIAGVIQAHFANLESWRKGDFLIRIQADGTGRYIDFEKTRQAEEGGLVYVKGPDSMSLVNRNNHLHRVIFDFDQGKLLVINRVEREQQLYDGLDKEVGEPVKRADDRIVLLNRPLGFGATKTKAALSHYMDSEKLPAAEDLLGAHGIANIKLLGCGTFGGDWKGDLQRRFDLIGNPDTMEEISHVGKDRYQVFSRLDIAPGNKMLGKRIYIDWDVQRQVPLKYVIYNGYREEDFPGATKPQWSGTANWKMVNGSYVPVSARLTDDSLVNVAGRYFHVSDDSTIELHWFSLSEELSEELFDEKILHDRKELDELLSEEVFETKPSEK